MAAAGPRRSRAASPRPPPPPGAAACEASATAARGAAAAAAQARGRQASFGDASARGPGAALAVFGAVLATAWVRHWSVPPVRPADAPYAEGFSAERAREVVADLAACGAGGVAVVGYEANEVCAVQAVQRHIQRATAGKEALVEVEVNAVSGDYFIDFIGGFTNVYRNLTNVVVRLRGTAAPEEGRCALLISSHFDSAIGSPAAMDANAEIGIMVELLRLYAHDPPPTDIVFNFNGGEEMIMPAAHGFITTHRWASDLCAVVNLESAGAGGRETVFQAGPKNRWILETYAARVARPHGNSVIQAFFQLGVIPGDTDYRIYRDFGDLPGVDFVITSNDWVYHTTQDDLRHADFRTVQRYGEAALELSAGLAAALARGRPEGPAAEEAAVYMDILGRWFVVYPVSLARPLHLSACAVLISWRLRGRAGEVSALAAKLLAALACAVLGALLAGGLVALTPAALAGAGHPELALLLYVPPALAGFLAALAWLAPGGAREGDLAAAGAALTAGLCMVFSATDTGALVSPLAFVWAAGPAAGDALAALLPSAAGAACVLGGYVLPWTITAQLVVFSVDFLSALSMRSGTTIPGDLVLAGIYGLALGILLAFSPRFLANLPWKIGSINRAAFAVFLCGVCLASATFPYSTDRPMRLFMQHVERSRLLWNLSRPSDGAAAGLATGRGAARREAMESGIWTVAMDWNNVATLRDHAPFGLPAGSVRHDDTVGVYGEMPYPLPIKPFVQGGAWTPGAPPVLPSRLSVEISELPRAGAAGGVGGPRALRVAVRGGPHVMLALGPRALVDRWSWGFKPRRGAGPDGGAGGADAVGARRPGAALPAGLPPARGDCDCLWLMFNEGGAEPSQGQSEAFSFTVQLAPGEGPRTLQLDVWAVHLETLSPEVRAHKERMPSWVSFIGWSADLQSHRVEL